MTEAIIAGCFFVAFFLVYQLSNTKVDETEQENQRMTAFMFLALANQCVLPSIVCFSGLCLAKLNGKVLYFIGGVQLAVASITFMLQSWWLYDEAVPETNTAIIMLTILFLIQCVCSNFIFLAFWRYEVIAIVTIPIVTFIATPFFAGGQNNSYQSIMFFMLASVLEIKSIPITYMLFYNKLTLFLSYQGSKTSITQLMSTLNGLSEAVLIVSKDVKNQIIYENKKFQSTYQNMNSVSQQSQQRGEALQWFNAKVFGFRSES